METPKLKEILELVKDTIVHGEAYNQTGMCGILRSLVSCEAILIKERYEVLAYLRENKPTEDNEYKEFRMSPFWIDEGYWWYEIFLFKETRQIRIDYLTALINNIK